MLEPKAAAVSVYAPRYWLQHLFFFILKIFAHLPYPVIYRIGIGFGLLLYRLSRARVRIARINLQRCFPHMSDLEIEQLVKKNQISSGIGLMESAMLWFGPKRNWQRITEIEGLEHYHHALEQGKGALLLGFHLNSLEIGGCMFGHQFPIAALYRKNENPLIESLMTTGRERYVSPIPRDATRDMVRWIKKNGVVWYAADQDYGRRQSIFVPFFGIPAATITATSRFAKLTGAPVIPFTQERFNKGKRIKLTLHQPFENMGQDPQSDAIKINQFLEKYLTEKPHDYLWVHRRFKTRPNEDDPSFYPKKQNRRRMTPERLKVFMEGVSELEEKNNKPFKAIHPLGIVYFVYYPSRLKEWFKPSYRGFLNQLKTEVHDGTTYQFQGTIRESEEQHCYLIFLEPKSETSA